MPASAPRRPTDPPSASIPAFFLYGEALTSPDERTVHVETIAARSELHGWHIRPHRHRDLQQILYIRRGAVTAALDADTRTLRGPAAVVVPPRSVHGFEFVEHTQGIVISFAAGLTTEIGGSSPGLMDFLERPAARALDRGALRATDLDRLAQMLLREFERSAPGRDAALRGLLATLLANLLRLAPRTPDESDGAATRDHEIVARFRQLVERRYREHDAIAAQARALGISQARLRRACLAVAGQSPIGLVHGRLLVEAIRQLRFTSMSVSQIAYYLGFDDPAYFSRFFTRQAGVSPRDFRHRDASR